MQKRKKRISNKKILKKRGEGVSFKAHKAEKQGLSFKFIVKKKEK